MDLWLCGMWLGYGPLVVWHMARLWTSWLHIKASFGGGYLAVDLQCLCPSLYLTACCNIWRVNISWDRQIYPYETELMMSFTYACTPTKYLIVLNKPRVYSSGLHFNLYFSSCVHVFMAPRHVYTYLWPLVMCTRNYGPWAPYKIRICDICNSL